MGKKIIIKKGEEQTIINNDLSESLEIYLEPDSKLIFADLQSLNATSPESLNRRIQIEKGATLTWIMEVHGGSVKNKIETFCHLCRQTLYRSSLTTKYLPAFGFHPASMNGIQPI